MRLHSKYGPFLPLVFFSSHSKLSCLHSILANCDDGLACTIDTCDIISGCNHTNKVCNDNNACTSDSCSTTSGSMFFYIFFSFLLPASSPPPPLLLSSSLALNLISFQLARIHPFLVSPTTTVKSPRVTKSLVAIRLLRFVRTHSPPTLH